MSAKWLSQKTIWDSLVDGNCSAEFKTYLMLIGGVLTFV